MIKNMVGASSHLVVQEHQISARSTKRNLSTTAPKNILFKSWWIVTFLRLKLLRLLAIKILIRSTTIQLSNKKQQQLILAILCTAPASKENASQNYGNWWSLYDTAKAVQPTSHANTLPVFIQLSNRNCQCFYARQKHCQPVSLNKKASCDNW